MNLTDLQAKHDEAATHCRIAQEVAANALLAANTAAEELGKAKLTAALSLIRKVYTEAPVGSAASVDILKAVKDISLVDAVRSGLFLYDLYGPLRGDQVNIISAHVPLSKSAFAAPYGSNIQKDQDSVTKQTIDNMQTQTSTHGVSTRPVEPAIPRAKVCSTAAAQKEANYDAWRLAEARGTEYEFVMHKDFGPGINPKAGITSVPQVDTLQKWAIRVPTDGSYSSIALVHIPTGAVTEGFPNMAAVCRYIKGRQRSGAAYWSDKRFNGRMDSKYDDNMYQHYA